MRKRRAARCWRLPSLPTACLLPGHNGAVCTCFPPCALAQRHRRALAFPAVLPRWPFISRRQPFTNKFRSKSFLQFLPPNSLFFPGQLQLVYRISWK
jgi:hypothetical protein